MMLTSSLVILTWTMLIAAAGSEARCPNASSMVLIPAGDLAMGSDRAERQLAFALSRAPVRSAGWFDADASRHRASTIVSLTGQDRRGYTVGQHARPGAS